MNLEKQIIFLLKNLARREKIGCGRSITACYSRMCDDTTQAYIRKHNYEDRSKWNGIDLSNELLDSEISLWDNSLIEKRDMEIKRMMEAVDIREESEVDNAIYYFRKLYDAGYRKAKPEVKP